MKNNKDWKGNKRSTFATLGASNHSKHNRQARDYYATSPDTIPPLLEQLKKDGISIKDNLIWENACGGRHLSDELEKQGYETLNTDIEPQKENCIQWDFLSGGNDRVEPIGGFDKKITILTNPPYKYAKEWVEESMDFLKDGEYLILFLKLQFLDGQSRRELFKKYPPKYIYVFSKRQKCAINGDFENTGSSAVAYAWYLWEKGFTGDPIIKWI